MTAEPIEQTKVYKLQLKNIGKFVSKNNVIKILDKAGVTAAQYKSLRKNPKADFTVVAFEDENQMEKFRSTVSQVDNPNTSSKFEVETFESRPMTRKDIDTKNSSEAPQSAEDNIAPLRNMPYQDQLKLKQKEIVKVLKKVKKETLKFETKICHRKLETLPFWLQPEYMKSNKNWGEERAKRQKLEESGEKTTMPEYNTGRIQNVACPVNKILSTPFITEYRNKCEFTFGLDSDGSPALGFRAGSFKNKEVSILRPNDECLHVQKEMKDFCIDFEKSILSTSQLPIYDVFKRTGVWRQISVRTSENEMLVLIQMHRGNIPSEEELNAQMNAVQTHFLEKSFGTKKIISVGFIFYDGHSVQEAKEPDVMFGQKFITEQLLGLKFKVSPTAFFQTNTKGAESLFTNVGQAVQKILGDDKKAVLLDVCCGTGTIGLSLASKVDQIIGVDNNQAGIINARENAEMNQITNSTFVAANAEHVLGNLLSDPGKRYNNTAKMEDDKKQIEAMQPAEKEDLEKIREILSKAKEDPLVELIAVVDPPRAGLHPSVIRALRAADKLNHIVYVSCNPTGSFISDATGLCASQNSKKRPGVSFYPVEATPVDMFPHTRHTELVTLFSRIPQVPEKKEDEPSEKKTSKETQQV